MNAEDRLFSDPDILFLVETVMPGRDDKEHVVSLVRDDPDFIEALLGHEKVRQRLIGDEEILLKVSPRLFFSVLIRLARQDLAAGSYTVERRQRQTVAIFDTRPAAQLIEDPQVRDYLVDMLASFTRIHGLTRRVRVRQGIWHKQRLNDLDVDSLIRQCNAMEEEHRFQMYKRIGDACLFLAGMFPEYIEAQQGSGHASSPTRLRYGRTLEDYEREGRTFYGLAADHEAGRSARLSAPLSTLAEHFTLAEKPLTFISNHYLRMRKHTLFEL